jgi:hypothetical protein
MVRSFDSLLEELHGLPSGSGPLECCGPRLSLQQAEQKLDKLMSRIAEMSTFRGEALKNRVLAAHPPGRPRDEIIAASPLAAAAIVELYSDIARHSPLFAPIVLASSFETSEEVLELMRNIRWVVERERRCSLLWQYDVFKGFVKHSRDRSQVAQELVQNILHSRDAQTQLCCRIESLLSRARAARSSGQAFCLQSLEDVWSVILAQRAAYHHIPIQSLGEIESLGAIELVEAFAAQQPEGFIDAVNFAAADGAALMKKVVVRSERSMSETKSMLLPFMYAMARAADNGATSNDQPNIIGALHKLLSCPHALPLFFRFFKNDSGEYVLPLPPQYFCNILRSYGFPLTSLIRSATGRSRPGMRKVSVSDALALCNVEYRDVDIAVLDLAVAEILNVKLRDGEPVPDACMSPMWYQKVMPEIKAAIRATGLYRVAAPAYVPSAPEYNPVPSPYSASPPAAAPEAPAPVLSTCAPNANLNQRPTTPAAIAQAIELALVTLGRHSWFVRDTWNSMHPFTVVKDVAVHLLVVGEHLAAAAQSAGEADFGGLEAIKARSRNHWMSIFRLEGPPDDCPEGYDCCDFDGSCMSCSMPCQYCPSLFRLRVEIREFMAQQRNDRAIEEVAEVDIHAARAVACEFQGSQLIPGAPQDVEEAARAMVAEGLVRAKGMSWSFTGPKRPVCFTYTQGHNAALMMKPIA